MVFLNLSKKYKRLTRSYRQSFIDHDVSGSITGHVHVTRPYRRIVTRAYMENMEKFSSLSFFFVAGGLVRLGLGFASAVHGHAKLLRVVIVKRGALQKRRPYFTLPQLHRIRNVQTIPTPGTGSVKSGLDLGGVG
jgi:hypothetical protein